MFKNLHELLKSLPDEKGCRKYFEQFRWEGGEPVCPYCQSKKAYRIEKGMRFKCGDCKKKYSVLVGTIFQDTKIPLSKWFHALYVATAHKRGISSCQLARDLGVTQKTAWFMMMRIRELSRPKKPIVLTTEVQVDEAYVGGLERNKHKNKRKDQSAGRSGTKTPVIGLIETNGKVVNKVSYWVTKNRIEEYILEHVDRKATLVTDGYIGYGKVGRKYDHVIVNHAAGEYKVGNHHTNSIENYWSHFMRMILGTYIQLSPKHLQRYCDEMAYRFNTRTMKDGTRFIHALFRTEGGLPYRELIANSLTSWDHGKEVEETPEE